MPLSNTTIVSLHLRHSLYCQGQCASGLDETALDSAYVLNLQPKPRAGQVMETVGALPSLPHQTQMLPT